MTPVFYAIGDVHGCDRLLSALHARIRDHHAFMFPGRPGHIVHLGDYIDRGPDSLGVIDRLRRGIAGWTTTCLLGNHEAMMFDCLDTDDPGIWSSWLNNGGAATVASLGDPVSAVRDRLSLAASLGPDRIAWLRNLPVFHDAAPYFFVHAGIDPDVPIASQSTDAMLWIRSRFLTSTVDHGRIVVHGHTPKKEPEVHPNRINVDTGAVYHGTLTAAVLDGTHPPGFLQATGERLRPYTKVQ